MRKLDTNHARHDPAHCLAPGLFRSLKRGDRKHNKLDVTYDFGDGESMRFVGFEPLGADDMRLLQGIVALAGPGGILLTPEPVSDTAKQLRLFLDPQFEAVTQDSLIVKESLTKLLAEVGMTDGGDNIKALRSSLLRMSNVTVLVTTGRTQASFHLMSHAVDMSDGRMWVALNPRITEAILGKRSHTRIDMREVRAIETDPARLIHQRLSGWIDIGKSGRVELDTVCSYIWPNPVTNANTIKTRRQTARKALSELSLIGWFIDEYASDKFEIKRTRSPS